MSSSHSHFRRTTTVFPTPSPPPPPPPPTVLAPVNASLPAITGSAVKGQTLIASTGGWLNSPTSFTYDWKRNGVSIGATASSYVLTASDIGATITCAVTATNSIAAATATSAGLGPVLDLAPVNTALPGITGTPTEGQTLSVSTGTWINTPTGYSYQWSRNGFPIALANSSTYVLVSADVGGSIACGVGATNSGGSSSALSNPVGPVGGAISAPVNTVLPALTGAAIVGQTLYTSDGTWDITPTSFTYQWYDQSGAIAGETNDSYIVVDADVGSLIHCAVTAYNVAAPSSPASSAATSAVADIDLTADTPVNTRTTSSGVTPMHWDTAFGSKTFADYIVRLQEGSGSSFTTLVQDIAHTLTAADLVTGATIDWASDGLVAIGATNSMRMRVETATPSGIFKASPYSSSITPTDAAFTPATLSGLINWSEPTSGNRFTSSTRTTAANDTDPIGCLRDLSGSALDVIQLISASRPVAHDSGGKSWMTFDGSDDCLHYDVGSPAALTDGSGQWTAFAAVKFNSVAGTQSIVDGDFPSARVAQFLRINGGVFESIAFTSGGSPIVATGTTSLATGTWYNVVVVCTTTTLKIYLNGTLEATATVPSALQTAANPLGFGASNASSSPGQLLNAQMSCGGVRTAPSSAPEIANLNTYLASTHA